MSYINLKYDPCKVPSHLYNDRGSRSGAEVPDYSKDGVSWYNLDTNRRITKLTGKVGLTNPSVAGSNWSIISEFVEINNIHPDDVVYMKPEDRNSLISEMKSRRKVHLNPLDLGSSNKNKINLEPRQNTKEKNLSRSQIDRQDRLAYPNKSDKIRGNLRAEKSSPTPGHCINDLEDLSDDVIDSLDIFSFSRINRKKARVVYVVDADTIDVVLFINPTDFCTPHWSRVDQKMIPTQNAHLCVSSNDTDNNNETITEQLLVKLRLRLYGIDAAEKNTVPGQRCKEWAEIKYKELNNIVYANLMGTDSKGRVLANLYECQNSNRSINQLLVDHMDPCYGKLCVSYHGEHKNDKFVKDTKAAKRDPEEPKVVLTPEEKFDGKHLVKNIDAWALLWEKHDSVLSKNVIESCSSGEYSEEFENKKGRCVIS